MVNRILAWHGWRTGNDWGFWLRIFGYGFAISTLVPSFSERLGYTKCWRLFGRVKVVGIGPWWK